MELILDSNRNALLALDLKVSVPVRIAMVFPSDLLEGLDLDDGHRGRHTRSRPIWYERTYRRRSIKLIIPKFPTATP